MEGRLDEIQTIFHDVLKQHREDFEKRKQT